MQQGILFSQSQTSRSHSSFLNHHETTVKWFLSKLCLLPLVGSAYLTFEISYRNTQQPLSSERQAAFLASIQVPTCALVNNSSLQRWRILELSSVQETHLLAFLRRTSGASKAIPVSLSGFIFVNSFSFLFLLLLRYSHPIAQCLWTNHF